MGLTHGTVVPPSMQSPTAISSMTKYSGERPLLLPVVVPAATVTVAEKASERVSESIIGNRKVRNQCSGERIVKRAKTNWAGRRNLTAAVAAKRDHLAAPGSDVDLVLEPGTSSHVGLVHYKGVLCLLVPSTGAAWRVLAHQPVRLAAAEQSAEAGEPPIPDFPPDVDVNVRATMRSKGELEKKEKENTGMNQPRRQQRLANTLQSVAYVTVRVRRQEWWIIVK